VLVTFNLCVLELDGFMDEADPHLIFFRLSGTENEAEEKGILKFVAKWV